jgi:gas vesicle protein
MMSEEQKEKMRLGREAAKLAKNIGNEVKEINKDSVESTPSVSTREFEQFKNEQKEHNNTVLNILEKLVNKDKQVGETLNETIEEEKVPIEDEIQPLSARQQELFEKYFDPTDGFKAWYNVNTNIFTVEVPMALSNMIDAQRQMYKQDLRSKKVDQNNILGSIDQWCRIICQNLKYNRLIKLK